MTFTIAIPEMATSAGCEPAFSERREGSDPELVPVVHW
jgi:hypothetical protein